MSATDLAHDGDDDDDDGGDNDDDNDLKDRDVCLVQYHFNVHVSETVREICAVSENRVSHTL